ncbi:MAG: cell filamentation protein Fic [Proteobacteria bacterium]|nr:MAG: cell filamentation protein Fic [Pseudomonadota bacterium]
MNKPPFTITNAALNLMVQIAEKTGRLQSDYEQQLHLRKNNRLRSIQASLAIENNSMTLEQVTDIVAGRRVLGQPKEIQEVKNAFDAYEHIPHFSPYSVDNFLTAHRLMTQGLVDSAGQFRSGDVGIFDTKGNVVHMGARPDFVPRLISDLLAWASNDDTPALIKSCVVHYEIEVIHPFADGNGRMGRLWQTVVLSADNPIFAWLPIETMVYEHQSDYYKTLAKADKNNDSTVFIEFMLSVILQTIEGYVLKQMSDKSSDIMSDKLSAKKQLVYQQIASYLQRHTSISSQQAQRLLGKSPATVRRYLKSLVDCGFLIASGENKARIYKANRGKSLREGDND